MWIRKGSRQSSVNRSDIDYYKEVTSRTVSNSDISIGFNKKMDEEIKLQIIDVDF